MMKRVTGSRRDYDSGRKNNWRRWGWNRLLERTGGREQTDPILYLAGPQDLDRAVAVSKGVPPTNLIAIDKYLPNVTRVRRNGGVAICADVIDVLKAWPVARPVAAVVLDFCCGFEPDLVGGLVWVMYRSPYASVPLWVNFQRGRDASANYIRADLARLFGFVTINRAHQFFLATVVADITAAHDNGARFDPTMTMCDAARKIAALRQPIFQSYKSPGKNGSMLVFDSAILSAPAKGRDDEQQGFERGFVHSAPAVQQLVRAAIAVRTMREDR